MGRPENPGQQPEGEWLAAILEQTDSVEEMRRKDGLIRRGNEELAEWLDRVDVETWRPVETDNLSLSVCADLWDCMHLGAIEARVDREVFNDPAEKRWQIEVYGIGWQWKQRVLSEVGTSWPNAKFQASSLYRVHLTDYGAELRGLLWKRPSERNSTLIRARLNQIIAPEVRIRDKGMKRPAGGDGPSAVAAAQANASVGDVVVNVNIDGAAFVASSHPSNTPTVATEPEPEHRNRTPKKEQKS